MTPDELATKFPEDTEGKSSAVLVANLNGTYHYVKVNSQGQLVITDSALTDFVTGAKAAINSDHVHIHEGEAYGASYLFTIANGATAYLQFTTPVGKYVHLKPSAYQTDGPKITVDMIENPTSVSAGTVVTALNRNRNSSNNSGCTLKANPTVTVGSGVVLPADYLGGGTGAGVSVKTGGATSSDNEWVLKPNTTYIFRVVNNGGASAGVNVNLFWYEDSNAV